MASHDPQDRYFKFKVNPYYMPSKEARIVQIFDVTNSLTKDQNTFQTLINACFSHELRNPLNSIIAKNVEKQGLYQKLKKSLNELESSVQNRLSFESCLKSLQEINKSNDM